MDEDYYNALAAENRLERKEINERKNEILRMYSTTRKQKEWRRLFPQVDLACYGLTEKQLNDIHNTVY